MTPQIISIIVCSFNGHKRINRTLEALATLIIPANTIVEIIFVDNGSSSSMLPMVSEKWLDCGTPYNLHMYVENKPGKVAALTKGIAHSVGEYILIVDDDNELSPNYLTNGLAYLLFNPKVGVLGGKGILPKSYVTPNWFYSHAYNFACGSQASKDGNVQPERNVVYGAGMWFRKSVLNLAILNGFRFIFDYDASNPKIQHRTNGGEDGELCWAIIFQGFEIHYLSTLIFNHWLDPSKLTEKSHKSILSRKTKATVLSGLYYRVFNNFDKQVKYFWLKEIVFIVINYIKNIEFSQKYFKDEFFRNVSNIRLLLVMNSDYDKLVNRLIEFRINSKV